MRNISVLTCSNESFLYHAAPSQPPLNVEWTLIGSQLSLYWEPVVAMESESEVTGYQVSFTVSESFIVASLFLSCIRLSERVDPTCAASHSKPSGCENTCLQCVTHLVSLPTQLSYRRQKHNEVNTLTTANSTAELTLPEEEDDYIIHIQTLSEGGLGPASDPIRIHQLSKLAGCCVVDFGSPLCEKDIMTAKNEKQKGYLKVSSKICGCHNV